VTIPQRVREALGLLPNTEVEFELQKGGVLVRKVRGKNARGQAIVRHLTGRGDVKMSTDAILALTRGE
jgi:AbrB family looped-hinge helix DNA binding protein